MATTLLPLNTSTMNETNSTLTASGVESAGWGGSPVAAWAFLAAQVLLVLFILGGNLLILLAIQQSKAMRKVSYYFIGNLAVADIMLGMGLLKCLGFCW